MKFLLTKKNTLTVEEKKDGSLEIKHISGQPFPNAGLLIFNLGGVEAVLSKCITQEELDAKKAKEKEIAEKMEKKREKMISEAEETIKNSSSSPEEILHAMNFLANQTMAVCYVDQVLSGENSLTNKLIKYGSYSWSVYDSGEVVIKYEYDNSRRFTNKRNSHITKKMITELIK